MAMPPTNQPDRHSCASTANLLLGYARRIRVYSSVSVSRRIWSR
jgi:hypothetical protein